MEFGALPRRPGSVPMVCLSQSVLGILSLTTDRLLFCSIFHERDKLSRCVKPVVGALGGYVEL